MEKLFSEVQAQQTQVNALCHLILSSSLQLAEAFAHILRILSSSCPRSAGLPAQAPILAKSAEKTVPLCHVPLCMNMSFTLISLPTYTTACQACMPNSMGYCAERHHLHPAGLGKWQKQDHKQDHKQAQLNAAGYRLRYVFCI